MGLEELCMVLPVHKRCVLTVEAPTVRRDRLGERAFTMIEVLVSLAIVAILAGAIAAAFTTGLRIVAPGGVTDRLSGAKDLALLEQILGRDGSRASCLTVESPFAVLGQTSSTCAATTGYGKLPGSACTSAQSTVLLCLGWPQLAGTSPSFLSSTCHVAVYSISAPAPPATPAAVGAVVMRTEYTVPLIGATSSSTEAVDQFDTVQVQVGTPTPAGYKPTGTYNWFRSLLITLTATGVAQSRPSQTLALHPVSGDPAGPAAAVTTAGSPC